MLDLLNPMAAVLVSWLLLFLVFSGLGTVVLRILGQPMLSGWMWLEAFWLGWILALAMMQLWHFVLPVNDLLLLLLALLAMLALWGQRRQFALAVRRIAKDWLFFLLLGLLALWMSNRALGAPVAYDTGFRDMQAVMWIDAFPLVPGLGNLFSSLAFNQSVYLYDALLDAFVWSGRSHYIATGLLVMAYLVYATKAALNLCRCGADTALRWSWIFATLTMPYVLHYTVTWGGITHFLTDTAVDLIGFLSMLYLLDYLQDRRADGIPRNYLIFRLAFVIVTGFIIKQSYFIFGFMICVFVILVWFQHNKARINPGILARAFMPIAIVACVMLIPWMARGIVTSGYIAYPQTIGRVDVDWAIPVNDLRQRQLNLTVNTRLRGAEREMALASWDWLGPWLRRFVGNIMPTMLPTMLAIAGLGLYALGIWRSRRLKRDQRLNPFAIVPLLLTILLWFLTYPEPKYARFVFWGVAAFAVILAFQSWQTISFRRRKQFVIAAAALCIAYVGYMIIQLETYPLSAGPERGFHPVPRAPYSEFATDSGLTLYIPASDHLPQCWQIALPCTPYPNPKLEARVQGELRHGFRASDSSSTNRADG